jgi:murein DD-endopeptidase MepM/ murein hydrolase activator NlpD
VKNQYLIKIVPPVGYRVFRFEFSRRHIITLAVLLFLAMGGAGGYYVWTLQHAEARVSELRGLTEDQQGRLQQINSQANELESELRAYEQQSEQIRKLIGDKGHGADRQPAQTSAVANPASNTPANPPADDRQSMRDDDAFARVADRVERLRSESDHARSESDNLRSIALRVLNMNRLEDLARARVLAAIPSINPAWAGVGIRSPFGWRIDPWPEFHQGVDLDVDYGDPIRAAAAGTVVEAQYDGGYGNKIDIDHGNGYHTWYCHLSKIDVSLGQYVRKAQHIAEVGSTGESTGPHLHYQIMLDGKAVDPAPYLIGVPDRILASLH